MATTTTEDIDPATGLPRVKSTTAATDTAATTVPVLDPNKPNATVKLSNAALSGAAAPDTAAGNEAVLARAQSDVLNQPGTSALQDTLTKSATDWAKNPMGDFNPQAYKQGRMEKSNADWANAFEAQRQQYGNVSGSGLLQQNMLQNALQHNVDQAGLESTIDQENYNRYVDAMGRSLNAGQAQNAQNENIFSQRLGNLGTVRGMAEGERSDVAASTAAGEQRDWTGEQMKIEEKRGNLALEMQTNTMNHEEKMTYLNDELATARANGDVGRQKTIIAFQTTQDIEKMTYEFGAETARMYLAAQLQEAKDSGDYVREVGLLGVQQKFEAEQAALDRAIDVLGLQLEDRKITINERQLTYQQIVDEVDAGRIDPNAAVEAVKAAAESYGIDVSAADPNAILNKINEENKVQQAQFALTNPEYAIYDGSGNFVALNDKGVLAYNAFVNNTLYGGANKMTAGGVEANTSDVATWQDLPASELSVQFRNAADPNNANNSVYTDIVNKVPTLNSSINNKFRNTIGGIPPAGTLVNVGGRLMKVTGGTHRSKVGRDHDEFELTDISTGRAQIFTGLSSSEWNAGKVNEWAGSL
jgi:hypothetical protein